MYQAVSDHRLQQHDRQAVNPDPKMLQHSTDWCGIGSVSIMLLYGCSDNAAIFKDIFAIL